MEEIVTFIKDIFMLEDNTKVGLSQFKPVKKARAPKVQVKSASTDLKLSDLMRGAY